MSGKTLEDSPSRRFVHARPIVANLITIAVYICVANIGLLSVEIDKFISVIWPCTGLIFALVFMTGLKLAPGIFVGALLSNLFSAPSSLQAWVLSIGNIGEAITAYAILCFIRRSQQDLEEFILPVWLFTASLLAPIIPTIHGLAANYWMGSVIEETAWPVFAVTWWSANTIGALVITPVILRAQRFKLNIRLVAKLFSIIPLTAAVYYFVFFTSSGAPYLFIVFFLLLIAYTFFGPFGTALSTLSFFIFASYLTLSDYKINDTNTSLDEILILNITVASIAYCSLILSSFRIRDYIKLATIVLIIGWSLSIWIYFVLYTNALRFDTMSFEDKIAQAEANISERLTKYVDALRVSAAYYSFSTEIAPEIEDPLANILKIEDYDSGMQRIGYVQAFDQPSLDQFIKNTRSNGYPEFTVKEVAKATSSKTKDSIHYIVTHIKPFDPKDQAYGLDLASETNRYDAANKSKNTGKPVLSDSIKLVQGLREVPGFLLFYPIFDTNKSLTTTAERQLAHKGWSYAPLAAEDFFSNADFKEAGELELTVYSNPETVIFSTSDATKTPKNEKLQKRTQLELAGQAITAEWSNGENFVHHELYSPTVAGASLALGTCLLAGLVVNIQNMSRRSDQIVRQRTKQLNHLNDSLKNEILDRNKAENAAKDALRTAKAANEAKSEFLATMSHEIRTPMNSVIGFAELLLQSNLEKDQRKWADYIRSSGSALLYLINDILDFSKIEAGKLELNCKPICLPTTVKEVVGALTSMADQKQLALDYKQLSPFPSYISGDETRLKQIVTNLVGNSIKFTDKGAITVSLAWKLNESEANAGWATLSVKDTGIGMHPSETDRLFKKFTQGDSRSKRKFEGTGLGLAICKRLVQLMNGKIEVTSQLEVGTTITIELPFEIKQKPMMQATRAPFKTAHTPKVLAKFPSLDILLVDDNRVNQQLGQTILKKMGSQVEVAVNGEEAVKKASSKHYAIIFMDCQMPVMDGYEATMEIRRREAEKLLPASPENKRINIIAITANAGKSNLDKCLKAGMDKCISKPCRIKDFEEVLETFFNA